MDSAYEYYSDICQCPAPYRSSAGDTEAMYDYQKSICVCPAKPVSVGMRDLSCNETGTYPVTVYNVNAESIGVAGTKAQYISIWNSDPDNQAVGTLMSGYGPFGFKILLNDGQTIDECDIIGVSTGDEDGIYAMEYAEEYE